MVAGTKGLLSKVFIVIQLDGVHRRPILKVLRGIMNMMRLVIQNRAALNPAGPRGNIAQNSEETLSEKNGQQQDGHRSGNVLYQSPETAETDRCHNRATAAARSQRVCHIEVKYLLYAVALGTTGKPEGILLFFVEMAIDSFRVRHVVGYSRAAQR